MTGREVTISVFLTEEDQAVLARRVEEMNDWLQRQRSAPDWTEQRELCSMLRMQLYGQRERYRRADERTTELAEIGITLRMLRSLPPPVPDWLKEALTDPIEGFPPDLAEQMRALGVNDGSRTA